MMQTVQEPARQTPVIDEADICVLGGSCTGVFAAVRAARLGARVIVVERQNCFGGTATCGLVSIWHSLHDTERKQKIIGGLTAETLERLAKRKAAEYVADSDVYRLNTEELKIELDELVTEHGIVPHLHTLYVAPHVVDGRLEAVIVESKSGRGAIKAKVFIDATGDGDLLAHLGVPFDMPRIKQPPTSCMKTAGLDGIGDGGLEQLIHEHREEFNLPEDWGWRTALPHHARFVMNAENHVFDVNCADARDLSRAEIEGRRQNRAVLDIVRKYGPPGADVVLLDLCSCVGIRETRHFRCRYRLSDQDVLNGTRFEDAIANGSRMVDIHLETQPGLLLRFLDGREKFVLRGRPAVWRRWREETPTNPTFYQVPYRCLVQDGLANVLAAGRLIDCDNGAFGAIRVMVNTNQMGEAAGTAAHLALDGNCGVGDVDVAKLRRLLRDGGSIMVLAAR
jgi:hypothetical protein